METSKEIIEQAKKRFKELKHKKYDEPSFFAGFLEAKALSMSEVSSNEVELSELKELYTRKCLQKRQLEKDLYEANKLLIDNGLKANPIKQNHKG